MNSVTFESGAITPSKIVCVGRNYVAHARELGNSIPKEPVIFIKPNSAIASAVNIADGDSVDHEAELSFLVQGGQLVAVALGLDLTRRALQEQLRAEGLPWERAKAFDGSAVFSEFVSFDGDVENLSLRLYVNGELRQSGAYDLMLFKPESLLGDLQCFLTLTDGDILMTGTPAGVAELNIGDVLKGEVYRGEHLLVAREWTVAVREKEK